MATFTPQARSTALRILFEPARIDAAISRCVEKGTMTFSELPLDQKQALANHPDTKIAARAKVLLAKRRRIAKRRSAEGRRGFFAAHQEVGRCGAGQGRLQDSTARVCHMHSGEGTKIGPDLSGVAVHTKEHLLIDILDPSRSVEGTIAFYAVETKKGLTLSGPACLGNQDDD